MDVRTDENPLIHWFIPRNPNREITFARFQGVIGNLNQSICEKNSFGGVPLDNDSRVPLSTAPPLTSVTLVRYDENYCS